MSINYRGLRVAVLAAGPTTGVVGGAERFYSGLIGGLENIGCRAELISLPADEPNFGAIMENYARCESLDLSEFDVVISTKAPTFSVRHPRHVLYLVHTVRAFDDMFDKIFCNPVGEHYEQRACIHRRDFEAMSQINARFAIGYEVADRLRRWRGLDAKVVHPPLGLTGFKCAPASDYFFLPGRLHDWKRVHLVIDAIKCSHLPMRLLIAGSGEAEVSLRRLAAGDPRIEFLGRVDDSRLIDLYSRAVAVPFVPEREDYGYITLEAFASGKPVVTCHDSGEPARLVTGGVSGIICRPDPSDICKALEYLYENREKAAEMGQKGLSLISEMSWPAVAKRLVDAAYGGNEEGTEHKLKVAVLDMQPIDPPVGGGRLRLLGLYHNLGDNIDCTYIGSYDWPGESYRHHRLSTTLEEIDVPLSDEHHSEASRLSALAGGKTVIDIAFGRLGGLSPDYLRVAKEAVLAADIVVFSHPWVYPLLSGALRPGQTVIYDSQNVEGYLRAQLLDEAQATEADLLRTVVEDELAVCRRADIVLACSHEDAARFNRLYRVHWSKLRVVPNGVMAFSRPLPSSSDRILSKHKLGIQEWNLVATFIGSAYGPNVEAGWFIVKELAPLLPDILFVIAGGVGSQVGCNSKNVIITGPLEEERKNDWLAASDIAVNPMFSGSGTNIKMFDFMACGLPTITTEVGARGIDTGGRKPIVVVEPNARSFCVALEKCRNSEFRRTLSAQARECVEDDYAWERISLLAGEQFKARHKYGSQALPTFSVVIPTYERHEQLDTLMCALQQQIDRDFEVVVVDQSASAWPCAQKSYGFPLTYYHSPVKGAIRARNAGASLAQGDIIAFTDDDCLPEAEWLMNSRQYFSDQSVVGVEGMIISDHLDDPGWRPVTNVGFEGIGFMTANLLVRAQHFRMLGGFDPSFDRPHFREDTDFGWRLECYGCIPYAKDVIVFHPAQPRSIERETAEARGKFFKKDAVLCRKHPDKYKELFYRECHYHGTEGFWPALLAGFQEISAEPPQWLLSERDKR